MPSKAVFNGMFAPKPADKAVNVGIDTVSASELFCELGDALMMFGEQFAVAAGFGGDSVNPFLFGGGIEFPVIGSDCPLVEKFIIPQTGVRGIGIRGVFQVSWKVGAHGLPPCSRKAFAIFLSQTRYASASAWARK